MGDIREITRAQKLQKIHIFLEKYAKTGGFQRFYPKSWDICAGHPEKELAQKLQFFSIF